MTRPTMSSAVGPSWTRGLRFVTGAGMAGFLVPTAIRLAPFVWRTWSEEPASEEFSVLFWVFIALVILGVFGIALVIHAIRGTRPGHPVLPFLIAIPIMLGVSIHRAGGLAPIIAGRQGLAVTQLLSIAVLAAALVIHVVMHELGHAAAARLMGLRFECLRVGPIAVRRVGSRLRLERNRVRIAGVLGSALSVPTTQEGFERAYAVTIAGGPAITVALTIGLWVGARIMSPPASDVESVASFVLWHSAFVGAFLSVTNLVPIRFRSGFRNDASRLVMALAARSDAAREALRFTLNASHGRRPRDWGKSAESLQAAADTDARYAPEVRLAALGVALDTGDVNRAREILGQGCGIHARENSYRQEFVLQEALLAALIGGDAPRAHACLTEVGTTPLPEYPLLAHAAVALAEGRMEEARASFTRWKDATLRSGVPGVRVGNEWAVELLEARLPP